jgi:excisionase family DNA binding protein
MSTTEDISLLNVPQVARRLNVSTSTVWRLVNSGELRSRRIGSGRGSPVRIDPAALEDFLHGSSRNPPADEAARTSYGSPGGGLEEDA